MENAAINPRLRFLAELGVSLNRIESEVFDIFRKCAIEDRIAPRNMQLIDMIQTVDRPNASQVAQAVRRLEIKGLIERHGTKRARFYKIVGEPLITLDPAEDVKDIFYKAAAIWSVCPKAVSGEQRSKFELHAIPRQAAMLVAREQGHSTCLIGRTASYDHTTVLHNAREAKRRAEIDCDFARKLDDLTYSYCGERRQANELPLAA